MTPQEITDLSRSINRRMREEVAAQRKLTEEFIRAEQTRLQMLCEMHTGHVFSEPEGGLMISSSGRRWCIYCRTWEPAPGEVADA